MHILLDTNYLLWALGRPERLASSIVAMLEDPGNEVMFSAVSIWEIAIKAALRRDDFNAKPDQISKSARTAGFSALPVTIEDAASVVHLPLHHRDPFDRLLIAQAIERPARLLTADPMLARYSELVWLQPA